MTERPSGMTSPDREEQSLHVSGRLLPGPHVAGYSIQRDEKRHVYVIDQKLVTCSPIEYRILTLLLEQINHCVSFAQLWEQFQAGRLADAAQMKQARARLMHVVSRLRTKIWASGLDIVAVVDTGYMLLSHTQMSAGHREDPPLAESPDGQQKQ